MTPAGRTRIRLYISIATTVLLLACTVAAWALPRPAQAAGHGRPHVGTAVAGADPCDLIIGPARDYCRPSTSNSASTPLVSVAASSRDTCSRQVGWLVLFSSAAIAAGIGLSVTAGRRGR